MNAKERVCAAFEGKPVDRVPVTTVYQGLYHADHFAELTGRPAWEMERYALASPQEHVAILRTLRKKAPFDIVETGRAPSRADRDGIEFVEKDGRVFRHDRRDGTFQPLGPAARSGHAHDYGPNETQFVFDKKDAAERIKAWKAEAYLADGCNDYPEAVIAAFGRDHFVVTAGMAATLYFCHLYVGLTNLLGMLAEQPDLIDYMSARILEVNIEYIRALAAAGGDALFIDDAMATSDVISPRHYERFCLPYVREMVREIHRLGHKVFVVYFGGVADRLHLIAETGADGLAMETSMKNYVNDVAATAAAVGDRMTLFGNIDPVGVLQNGTDEELQREIERQIEAGRKARGFILSTGSPITPGTPLSRVRRYIDVGRKLGGRG
jgi:uroporphyrinogen-III decarboxylase